MGKWEKEADLKAEGFPGKERGADGIGKKRMPGAGAQRGWGVEKAPLTALASGLAQPVSFSSSSGTKKPQSPGWGPSLSPTYSERDKRGAFAGHRGAFGLHGEGRGAVQGNWQ